MLLSWFQSKQGHARFWKSCFYKTLGGLPVSELLKSLHQFPTSSLSYLNFPGNLTCLPEGPMVSHSFPSSHASSDKEISQLRNIWVGSTAHLFVITFSLRQWCLPLFYLIEPKELGKTDLLFTQLYFNQLNGLLVCFWQFATLSVERFVSRSTIALSTIYSWNPITLKKY